jgi:hypothetical protein
VMSPAARGDFDGVDAASGVGLSDVVLMGRGSKRPVSRAARALSRLCHNIFADKFPQPAHGKYSRQAADELV